jgi:hypothetical protein
MEPEGSLPCSQGPASGPFPEPVESIRQPPTLYLLRFILVSSSLLDLDLPSGLHFRFSNRNTTLILPLYIGRIITNRRVKLRVWLGNAQHHPWLRNSKANHQPVILCLQFFSYMKGVILVNFTPKGPDLVPRDFHMFGPMKEALWGRRFSSDEEVIGSQDATNFFSLTEFKKKNCETLEPVRLSRRGLRWKVILVSFLYIYNKCAFFKSPVTFWLTFVKRYRNSFHCSSHTVVNVRWFKIRPLLGHF